MENYILIGNGVMYASDAIHIPALIGNKRAQYMFCNFVL
jgi:hypothetical protein